MELTGANPRTSYASTAMKAIVYHNYGPPDVLVLEDIEKPVPSENDVMIKVRAASVNPYDWHFMRGLPYGVRVIAGLRRPKVTRLGADVAGEVESAGKNVTRLMPGDAVFGFLSGAAQGAFAEYACAPESAFARKPDCVTFEQAAAAPIAGFTALQGLRNKGHIQPGQRVLINGASGGVGTFAVQIAKVFGAHVTAVCSTRNVELVRSIGADCVIDYVRDDFTRSAERYDLVFDAVGNHSLIALRRILSPNGILVGVGGTTDPWMLGPLSSALTGLILSQFGNRKLVGVLAKGNNQDLITIGGFMESGTVSPVIDRRYPLREVPDAIRYVEDGHARGKVIINL
jgi:NADPH:quinone reductase-like Zn-dependent oxidoreductase